MSGFDERTFTGDDSMKKHAPLARLVGLWVLVAMVAGGGLYYQATAETTQDHRSVVTVERHEFPDATCFTVVWNLRLGRERQVRLDCVGK